MLKAGDRIFLSYGVCDKMSIPRRYGNRILIIAAVSGKDVYTTCGWGIHLEHVIPVTPLIEALC
jgi:hypothetical protein